MSEKGAQQSEDGQFQVFHGKWTVVDMVQNLGLL